MDVYATRRDNLRLLFDRHGGRQAVALKLGHANGSHVSHLAGPNPTRNITEDTARKIERAFDLDAGSLDRRHLGEKSPPELREVQEPRGAYHVARVNDQLLTNSAKAVLEAAQSAAKPLNADQIAEVIALVYRCGGDDGSVDTDLARRLVDLISR